VETETENVSEVKIVQSSEDLRDRVLRAQSELESIRQTGEYGSFGDVRNRTETGLEIRFSNTSDLESFRNGNYEYLEKYEFIKLVILTFDGESL